MLDTCCRYRVDASYEYFMLDGQMAVVDDYLEVRPEAEGRLRALAAAAASAWAVVHLMDEFLSSARRSSGTSRWGSCGSRFGGAMEVGYLPDMFGHIAQMPQILRQAGFAHTVVWRACPRPSRERLQLGGAGRSTVRPSTCLSVWNGAALPDDAKALVRRRPTSSKRWSRSSSAICCA